MNTHENQEDRTAGTVLFLLVTAGALAGAVTHAFTGSGLATMLVALATTFFATIGVILIGDRGNKE